MVPHRRPRDPPHRRTRPLAPDGPLRESRLCGACSRFAQLPCGACRIGHQAVTGLAGGPGRW
jgi:hypothetical protein